MDFRTTLETLRDFFQRDHSPFAVVGAMALQGYGRARATQDLDLLAPAEAQDRVVAFLESLGYETLHRSSGYSNHLHRLASFGRVDFVYVRGETSEAIFAAAEEREILPGLQVPVPRPEHLAAMKVHAMKNDPTRAHQELADIRFLLTVPGVDRSLVLDAFAKRGLSDEYRDLEKTLGEAADD